MAHKKSSFAKLALFFGFGGSAAASRPPSLAGSDVGLAFVASMSAEDAAAAAFLSRSDRHGATRGQKRAVPSPSEEGEGTDRAEVEQQQRRRGAASNKRLRRQEGVGVAVLLDLRQRLLTEEVQLVAEFLRRCSGCNEELDGRDIYMYQGDKAFCSEECRHEKIQLDEMTGKHPIT